MNVPTSVPREVCVTAVLECAHVIWNGLGLPVMSPSARITAQRMECVILNWGNVCVSRDTEVSVADMMPACCGCGFGMLNFEELD